MRAGAVVQARMGSQRCPGKVLAPLAGRPLLARVVERLQTCETLAFVGVATTDDPRDDPIASWCTASAVPCFRGPEDDVLHRVVSAATTWRLDPVVRITADCPFVCPRAVDDLVRSLREVGADYAHYDAENVHEGIDPFSLGALRTLDAASLPPDEREHLALLVERHPESFRVAAVPTPPGHQRRPGRSLSVDTPAELARAQRWFGQLQRGGAPFVTEDLLALLDAPAGREIRP